MYSVTVSQSAQGLFTRIDTDYSRWPVVVVRAPSTSVSDEAIDAFMEEFEAEVDRRGSRFAIVLDLRQAAGGFSPTQRRSMVQKLRASDDQREQVAGAFVFDSTLMRGVLTAVLWLRTPPYPIKVFADPIDAVTWCEGHCEGQGISTGDSPMEMPARAVGASSMAPPLDRDIEERLRALDGLRDKGLVDEQEYRERRARILDDL